VAGAIAGALKLHFLPRRAEPTTNAAAYDLYLQALSYITSNEDPRTLNIVVPLLDQAITYDPGFAKANELKALAYWGSAGERIESPAARPLVYESASAALAVDPTLVVARLRGAGQPISPRLEQDERLARAVVSLADASRSLTDAVVRTPSLLVVVDHLVARERDELVAEAAAAVVQPAEGLTPAAALRRWKQREFLRIALRDLLGHSDLAGVGRELADLADACLGAALVAAAPGQPLAIIAMGKLGGQELNYASDVDVLFVHDGDGFEAARAARRVVSVMSEPGPDGIVFRTDTDLRPDGRDGPLSRTVAAYADYYQGRALTWERQALIKARAVAGDTELIRRWFDVTQQVLWERPRPLDARRPLRPAPACGWAPG